MRLVFRLGNHLALRTYSGDATLKNVKLILASASPRRRELLAQAGIKFAVAASNIDEERLPDEAAAAYVLRLAEEKALAVWNELKTSPESAGSPEDSLIVLGAD